MNQRVILPSAVAKVFITDQLYDRAPPVPDYLREKLAIQDLAICNLLLARARQKGVGQEIDLAA